MYNQLHIILVTLKKSTHSIKQLDQILTQTITTGLIHNTPTWNCVLRAYSKSPTPIKAILIYNHFIKSDSVYPDNYTYPSLFKACIHLHSLHKGREIHGHITKIGLDCDIYVQNGLINLYGSMAKITDARLAFDIMPQRDVASWNTLLAVYNRNPSTQTEALALFKEMLREGVQGDDITLVILLTHCARVRGLEYGRSAHGYFIKVEIPRTLNLENTMLDMYTKCGEMNAALELFIEMCGRRDIVSYTIMINGYVETGDMNLACEIFNGMVGNKDVVLWNSLIHGYVKVKQSNEAIALFKRMEKESVKPDETTTASVLAACANLADLEYGRYIHRFSLRNNIRWDVFVGTALIHMYSKCGCLGDAMVTFYKMEEKDVFAWTAMIEGLANNGYPFEALGLFDQMEKHGIKPNEATFVSILAACRQAGIVNEGLFLFKRMVKFYKIEPKMEHFGCLIDLLSKAGLLEEAEEFIKIMVPGERLVAYKTLLTACLNNSKIDFGLKIADELIKFGSQSHGVYVLLSNFYALAGQWAKVTEVRSMMKKVVVKEPGISLVVL